MARLSRLTYAGRRQASRAADAALKKPVFSVNPAITGTAQVGQTLSLSNGTASPAPTSRQYIWEADNVPISGAAAATYALTASEEGKVILGTVVAIRNGVQTVAKSVPTAAVIAA